MIFRGVIILLVSATASSLESAHGENLTVRVIDYASIAPDTLKRASSIAEAIYRKAGLETKWVFCEASEDRRACPAAPVDTDLVAKILAPGMEDPKISPDLLGTTNREISVSFVFYSHVRASRLGANARRSELLAAVMAHEVGHLLGLEHSQGGPMRESFGPFEIEQVADNSLTFTASQAQYARTSLITRLERTRLARITTSAAGGTDLESPSTHGRQAGRNDYTSGGQYRQRLYLKASGERDTNEETNQSRCCFLRSLHRACIRFVDEGDRRAHSRNSN